MKTKRQNVRAALWRFKAAITVGDSLPELEARVEEIVRLACPDESAYCSRCGIRLYVDPARHLFADQARVKFAERTTGD